MYEQLKSLLIRIMPAALLRRIEYPLRRIYAFFLTGRQVECNLCKGHFSTFIPLSSGDLLCPRCGSLPRQRRLWEIVQKKFLANSNPDFSILHFSPSRMLSEKIRQLAGSSYLTSSFDQGEGTGRHFDITGIDAEDDSFDLIICYHVLEHIKEDVRAIKELYRICRPYGTLLVQTPLKQGDIYENDAILTPGERKLHFGQTDHVRIYSEGDLSHRLRSSGWKVEVAVYSSDPKKGLKEGETVFFCTKA